MISTNYIGSVDMFAIFGQSMSVEKAEQDTVAVENVSKSSNADVVTYDYKDTFETSAASKTDSGIYNKPTSEQQGTSSNQQIDDTLEETKIFDFRDHPRMISKEELFNLSDEELLSLYEEEPSLFGFSESNYSFERKVRNLRQSYGGLELFFEKLKTGFDINVIPTTAEGKIEYNKKVLDLWNNNEIIKKSGISMPLLSCFNDVDGMDWAIGDGAEELIGHEIMEIYQLGNTSSKLTSNTSKGSTYGVIDEYGFAVKIPAIYFSQSQKERIEYAQEAVIGTVFDPTIKYEDALGLAGMNINERKTFLTRVQNILDQVTPEIKSTQLKYTIGDFDLGDDKMIGVSGAMGLYLSDKTDKINQALKEDKTLFDMLSKANNSQNKHVDELTISVTNSAGVPLAKNEIIVSGNGKSMKTTVDEIKNISYASLLNKIRRS
jgi:hypothetical protein